MQHACELRVRTVPFRSLACGGNTRKLVAVLLPRSSSHNTHEELDTHHKMPRQHKQSTPRAGEGLPAGSARLGRAALHTSQHAAGAVIATRTCAASGEFIDGKPVFDYCRSIDQRPFDRGLAINVIKRPQPPSLSTGSCILRRNIPQNYSVAKRKANLEKANPFRNIYIISCRLHVSLYASTEAGSI